MFAKTIAFSGLAALASAHILMTNPVPYGASSLNNSPLDASGSDFPCKQRPGVYDAEGASNVYPQGSTQQLSFKGTAVHGGGSCQVSVTTDRQPDANSVWKVIKSIEGGCPSRGAAGNIGNDPNSPVPDTYDFEIPSDLPAGEYSLAWTWFNKIGNREMYMNCAPITVTGSGGDVSTFNALPDMFVANINDCRVSEGNDVQFPNPGAFVVQENGPTNVFAAPQGACATGSSGSPSKDPEPVEPSEPTETPQPPQVTDAPETPQPTGLPGNVFITVSSSPEPTQVNPPAEPTQVTPPAEPTEVAPPTKPTEPATPPTEPTEPATPPAAPVTGGQSGPCTNEGAWNCIGGNSFQRCASGAWSAVQQLARGNSCEEGVSDSLTLVAKRFFPRRPSGAMV